MARPYRVLGSSLPTNGGAPRLIADLHPEKREPCLGVWDTGTGALLHILPQECMALVTYHREPNGRPGVAAETRSGHLHTWDGDDFRHLLSTRPTEGEEWRIFPLIVYEEPTSGRSRLVTA
jgi:hypothetical protein